VCSLEPVTENDTGASEFGESARIAEQINEIHQWVQELRTAVDQLAEALGRLTPPG
jgi:hypothetical protein